ncbi:MAG: hypothetical protein EOP33_01580 [Rickettsiaceae bacterium]|nr:MAG: hypothetical protein EOP33_01580 [Rickettsiaceae bacterium]
MFRTLNLLILIAFLLSGCTGDKCIDADDFGYPRFTISARYAPSELSQISQSNQIAPWRDSNFRVNGNPLLIVVKTWEYETDKNNSNQLSAWCPWYGGDSNASTLSPFCLRLNQCQFKPVNTGSTGLTQGFTDKASMCPCDPASGGNCSTDSASGDAPIINAPCLLKNGVGLYGLIADPATDPNTSFISQRSPPKDHTLTFHLGDPPTQFQLFDSNAKGDIRPAGGILYNYDRSDSDIATTRRKYASGKLYFKILDKYYNDNNGQYKVAIKSGVTDSRPDPIQFLTNLVITNLFGSTGSDYGIIRNIYTNVVSNPGYQLSVQALLVLYIMFTTFSFLIGTIELTHTELISRVVKISIISVLLNSAYSWEFFNNYLFSFFTGGVQQILQIINQAGQVSTGSSSIIALMIAPQTMAKLLSLLFVDRLGFIYIILFLIALYFLFMMIFEATIIYLTALIAIGIIIVMAPIFLCFMLFQITRSLFENWLKQLISYAIQPLILFAGLAFISIIVEGEIYSSLGFKVCKRDFPNLGPISELFGDIGDLTSDVSGIDISLTQSIFYSWFPSPMKGEDFTKTQAVIPVPLSFLKSDGTLCEAYQCFENRYIELPYLSLVTDQDRINNFFNGHFVQLNGLLLIFAAVYLLSKFNSTAVSVANFLASTSNNMTSIQNVGQRAFVPIAEQINRPITAVKEQINKVRELIGSKTAAAYEKMMNKGLRKDAISDSANSTVLKEVKQNTGLDQQDIKANAIKDYRNALKNRIKELNPELTAKDLEAKAKELSYRKYTELGEDFSGSRFKQLSEDATATRQFQEEYVKAHQALSNRGIGLFGKNIASLRAVQNINYDIRAAKEAKQANRQNTVERGYGRLEEAVIGKTMNYADSRLRTYGETLADENMDLKNSALREQVRKESAKVGEDVLSPEYRVRLENSGKSARAEQLKTVDRAKLRSDIFSALTDKKDPVLMGDTFMRTKATDSQLRKMIDRTYQTGQEFSQQDLYLGREEKYKAMQDRSFENIKSNHDLLSNHYGRTDIRSEEMVALLQDYYGSASNSNTNNRDEAAKLAQSLTDFDFSTKVLDKIDKRKEAIDKEIEKVVEIVNKKRAEANMPEYKKQNNQNSNKISEERKLRSVNDYLRK